ncbi:hypothetical protein AB0H00_22295 [Nocardia sp. NPDC023852]|uniref:hypothetical protein n=1 Tax=Nocardia sp. NPDC023852 TaxID=3154697 RepID=UPI0033FF306C
MRSTIYPAMLSAAVIATSAMTLMACNSIGGTSGPTTDAAVTTSVDSQPGGTNAQSTVRTVGKTGWYGGLDITVNKATVVPSQAGGGQLLIDITYQNTTSEVRRLSENTYLQIGEEIDASAVFDTPTVSGNDSAAVKITTTVASTKDLDRLLDTVTVVYGQASDNQTKIPIAAAAQVESIQPQALNITGTLVQNQTTIEITGGKLSPSYKRNQRNKMDIELRLEISGESYISNDYFTVRTPSGQIVVADVRVPDDESVVVLATAVFVVPNPTTGPYVLTYDSSRGKSRPAPTLSFTIG